MVSRRPERAQAFARRAAEESEVEVRAVGTVEEAVRERDVVVVATNSPVPVLDAGWIAPGTHVTTLDSSRSHATKSPPPRWTTHTSS